ncbi:MAG: phosphatidylglycerophosphatase A [Planctomycetes bacterium]|nr:phosphatidylglycerophosphatase A [Planctomycetota bacterium]
MLKGDFFRKTAASFLGLGYLPICPGTWASGGAAALAYVFGHYIPQPTGILLLAAAFVGVLAAGHRLAEWAQKRFADSDPHVFVLDEVAGQWLTYLLTLLVVVGWYGPFTRVAVCFVAFRFYDIFKPSPIGLIDRRHDAESIIMDDIAAGVLAAMAVVIIEVILFYFHA